MDGPPAGLSCDGQIDLEYINLHQSVLDLMDSKVDSYLWSLPQAHIKSQFVCEWARSSQTAQVLQHKERDNNVVSWDDMYSKQFRE